MPLNILKSRLRRTYDINLRNILLWEQFSDEEKDIVKKNAIWLNEGIEICSRPKLYPELVIITNSTFYFVNDTNVVFSTKNDSIKGATPSFKQINFLPKHCNLIDIHTLHPDIVYELEIQNLELLWETIEVLKYLRAKSKTKEKTIREISFFSMLYTKNAINF